MIYTKKEGGRDVFVNVNDETGIAEGQSIRSNEGEWISNPTPEILEKNGWVEFIPPTPEPTHQTEPDLYEVMEAVKKALSTETTQMSDEDALAVAALFPTWISMMGKEVKTGERYWFDERLWKVLLDHTVQESWTPDVSPSLFVEVTIEQFPEWKQPTGATDSYNKGDHVSHNGHHWESDVDANVWEPGVAMWTQLPD